METRPVLQNALTRNTPGGWVAYRAWESAYPPPPSPQPPPLHPRGYQRCLFTLVTSALCQLEGENEKMKALVLPKRQQLQQSERSLSSRVQDLTQV